MKRVILLLLVLSLLMSMSVLVQAADNPGAVYALTNDANGNEIVIYNRAANGTLTLAGFEATGGSGKTTEPGNALVRRTRLS